MNINDIVKLINKDRNECNTFISFVRKGQNKVSQDIKGLIKIHKIHLSVEDGFYEFFIKDINNYKKIERESLEVVDYLNSFKKELFTLAIDCGDGSWIAVNNKTLNSEMIFGCENCDILDSVNIVKNLDNLLIFYNKDNNYDESNILNIRSLIKKADKDLDFLFFGKSLKNKIISKCLYLYKIYLENKVNKNKELLKDSIEQRVKNVFNSVGCSLINMNTRRDLIDLTWSSGNDNYYSIIDFNLNVISAGICLSDTDSVYDLLSLVSVVREGEYLDLIHHTR